MRKAIDNVEGLVGSLDKLDQHLDMKTIIKLPYASNQSFKSSSLLILLEVEKGKRGKISIKLTTLGSFW